MGKFDPFENGYSSLAGDEPNYLPPESQRVDSSLSDAARQSSNNPSFNNRAVDVTENIQPWTSPTGDQYWDPSDRQYKSLGAYDPGVDAGKYALTQALNDPSSDVSRAFYYGGSKDFANKQAQYFSDMSQRLQNRQGPEANFGAGPGSYNQMFGQQRELAGYLQNVANGTQGTPAEDQLRQSNQAVQAGLRSNLASTGGGLLAAAAANSATNIASGMANRGMDRDMRLMKLNQANAARDQLAGLTTAMRNNETSRVQDVARLQNLNAIRNSNAAADAQQMGLGSLQRGLEGTVMQEQARGNAYNAAIGNEHQYAKFADNIAEKNTNTLIGGVQGGLASAGQLYSEMTADKKKESKEP